MVKNYLNGLSKTSNKSNIFVFVDLFTVFVSEN